MSQPKIADRPKRPIKEQFRMASVIMVVPLVILSFSSVLGLMYATSTLDRLVSTNAESSLPLAKLEANVRGASVLAFAALGSPQVTNQFRSDAEEISTSFDDLLLSESLGESVRLVSAARNDWDRASDLAIEQLDEHATDETVPDSAYLGLVPFSGLAESSARQLGDAQEVLVDKLDQARSHAESVRRLSMAVTLAVCLFSLIVVAVALRRLARNIARPIELLSVATGRLGAGHLSHRVDVESDDELGQLADAFNVMAEALERGQLDLAHQASHDPLTGLGNRNLLLEHLESSDYDTELADGTRRAVLLADLDDFKKVNDVAGHLAGDRVLVEAGKRLRRCLRRQDVAVRLGGDEFAIVLNDLPDLDTAVEVSERILQTLRDPYDVDGNAVEVSASIGIAEYFPGLSSTEILRNVDLAMYEAKYEGKNAYKLFRDELHTNLSERVKLESELKTAIEQDQLVAFYQPIVNIETSGINGVEALVRWNHPSRGLLAPDEFIPVAEETGLVVPLGWWMLQRACTDLAEWRAADSARAPRYVSINMSAQALQGLECVERIESIVVEAGVSPPDVVLEITETEMLHNGQTTRAVLTGLRRLGFRIAIDDFGTGYSSLAYLTQYPVDILKIDKAFIDALGTGSEEHALAAAIVAIAQALHLDTIAEGIERPNQATLISDLGCVNAQGYHYSRPIPAAELGKLLRTTSDAGL